jgi:hypothetical protein
MSEVNCDELQLPYPDELWCRYDECDGFLTKEDFELCMEACKREWCYELERAMKKAAKRKRSKQ